MFACPNCFAQQGLKRRILKLKQHVSEQRCDRHPAEAGVSLFSICGIIDEVFRSNYELTDFNRGDEKDLCEVLSALTRPNDDDLVEQVANELIRIEGPLSQEDSPFYRRDYYYSPSDMEQYRHSILWDRFREQLLYERRFFNLEAREILTEIFSKIHLQKDESGKRPIYMIRPGGEGSSFTRARLVDKTEIKGIKVNPIAGLSGPPKRRRKAGRLNAAGMPVFYAAYDVDTCIAELRPAVGSTVACAEFDLCEEICVLDTTCFEGYAKSIDIFNEEQIRRFSQWTFLQVFMEEIAKPILPSDEHLDYIPTQAVAEFLNTQPVARNDTNQAIKIDALIYNSSQRRGGKNIALFGNASRVAGNTEIDKVSFWNVDTDFEIRPRIKYKVGTFNALYVTGAEFAKRQFSLWEEEIPF